MKTGLQFTPHLLFYTLNARFYMGKVRSRRAGIREIMIRQRNKLVNYGHWQTSLEVFYLLRFSIFPAIFTFEILYFLHRSHTGTPKMVLINRQNSKRSSKMQRDQ